MNKLNNTVSIIYIDNTLIYVHIYLNAHEGN